MVLHKAADNLRPILFLFTPLVYIMYSVMLATLRDLEGAPLCIPWNVHYWFATTPPSVAVYIQHIRQYNNPLAAATRLLTITGNRLHSFIVIGV